MERKRDNSDDDDQLENDRALKRQAAAIDMAPFETLPIDVMIKIFLESQFTIKELHVLCNMSRKLRAVCNERKVWEEIFFRKVLGKEREMKEAKRNGTLPELMAQMRETEEYAAWKSNNNTLTNLFTRLVAFMFYTKYLLKHDETWLTMQKDGVKEVLYLFKANVYDDYGQRLNTKNYGLRLRGEGNLWEIVRNKYRLQYYTTSANLKAVRFKTLGEFIDAVELILENGWAPLSTIVDKKPLLCSICSAVPSAFACASCETRAYCSHACASLDPIGKHVHAKHDMDLVLPPHIYIGSLAAAQRLPPYIGAVLSVLSSVDERYMKELVGPNRALLFVDLDDDPEAPIQAHWDDMADFIHEQADVQGRDILVHCHAGMSRSVSAVIYYMIKYRGYTDADAALEMIQRARPVAGPNEGFMEKLRGAAFAPAAAARRRGRGRGGKK